jgi:hypothetical protein
MTTKSYWTRCVSLAVFPLVGLAFPTIAAGQAAMVIQLPQSGAALISGTGFPPSCESSCLISVRGGAFSNQESLGCFGTDSAGSWGQYNFTFLANAETASDYLWRGYGSCEGKILRGSNPGGGYPRVVSLTLFDSASVATTMTIRQPDVFVSQVVRGQGLPANLVFTLLLGGMPTNSGQTDSNGAFAFNFSTTNTPSPPRTASLDFGGGMLYTGQESTGAYPHAVGLAPMGSLSLEAPNSVGAAVISGAGFPPGCETSVLSAISNGVSLPLGAFNTPPDGMWTFNFGYPPEADAATSYRWQGQASCDGLVLEGPNPGGSYPRDVFLSSVSRVQVAIDVKPGACPNVVNAASRGVLRVAILGTAAFDVTRIDPASVRLEAAAPLRSRYEDVATPNECPQAAKVCTNAGPDGALDLVLLFDVQALGVLDVPDGTRLPVRLSGKLKDGTTTIEGTDILIVRRKKP